MKRSSIKLAFLFLVTFGCNLQAAQVENLYTVELPVADQTTAQRLAVFNQAFREVVVKISGTDAALEHPGFERPLKNSSRYVHQFRYVILKNETSNAFDSGQLILRVDFNQELVENLMRENDIPVWGKERPSTLLLISYDVNKNASLVSSDTTPDLVDELDEMANRLGLPVLFPLLDLEDRMIMGVRDIMNSNDANIDALAARYGPDAVLSGQLIGRAGKGWQGVWQARFSDQLFSWTYQAASRQDALNQAISQLARTLASEYALESYKYFEQDVLFSVDQMTGVEDHIKVQKYLQSLDAIESARVILIDSDKVTYRVKLRNTAEDLHRLISLGYVLEQLELPQINAATDDLTVIMNYRYTR